MKHEQQTRLKFNNLKRYYDKTWDLHDHTLHVGVFNKKQDSLEDAYQNANDVLVNKLISLSPISSSSHLLDVGCGAGRTLVKVCDLYNCRGVGVDISDAQIADAKNFLKQVNKKRKVHGKSALQIRFVRASASDISRSLKNCRFTHVMSQEAIFLVQNKAALFSALYQLLVPGGVCVIADFLKESVDKEEKTHKLLHELVNWTDSLSEQQYKQALEMQGLEVIETDRKDSDMIKTYTRLAERLAQQTKNDTVLEDLLQRYETIVHSVQSGTMGWIFISTRKPNRPAALRTGI